MKQIKLSEEQDKQIKKLLREQLDSNPAIAVSAKTPSSGNIDTDVRATMSAIDRNGLGDEVKNNKNVTADVKTKVNGQDATVEVNPINNGNTIKTNKSTSMYESVLISKKQLSEAKLKNIKKNSKVVKVKNLFK